MRKTQEDQLVLGWRRPSQDLPADIRKESQGLVAQLLRAVVEAERREEGAEGEREDHLAAS